MSGYGWDDVMSVDGIKEATGLDVNLIRSPSEWEPSVKVILMVIGILTVCYFIIRLVTDPEAALDYEVEIPEQAKLGWTGTILSEPKIKVPGSTAIQCYAPATGADLGLVNPVTPDGIDRAIARAEEAQKTWATTGFSQRRELLKTILKYTLDNQETIARVACLDSGKTMIDASFGEILVTVERIKWTIDHGEKALKPEKRPRNFLMMYKTNEVRWEPLGVVASCVSWNYPFHNLLGPIISAIFAGNAIVVKASEQTAWSSKYFTAIVRNALEACSHDPNLVQTVVCWPSAAGHLTSHPKISHLTFIGSREVAHEVAASASKSLTELCLELGGKDPAIVLGDLGKKEQDRVAATLIRGVFQSAGQNCVGLERIIIHRQLYNEMIHKLEQVVRQIRPGSALDSLQSFRSGALNPADQPVDMGACISAARFDHLESLIQEAVSQGAKLLVGGSRYNHPSHPRGHYFQPTLLVNVTTSMRLAQEELFAPIAVVMRARDIEHAIEIANSTPYALGASVFGSWSDDLELVTSQVKAGMVAVNDFAAYYAVQLPFGGVKGSGYGRFAGKEGLRALCAMKSVCRDRTFIKTSIPPPLRLPYADQSRAWEMCCGIVELGYGDTIWRSVAGLAKIVELPFAGLFGKKKAAGTKKLTKTGPDGQASSEKIE